MSSGKGGKCEWHHRIRIVIVQVRIIHWKFLRNEQSYSMDSNWKRNVQSKNWFNRFARRAINREYIQITTMTTTSTNYNDTETEEEVKTTKTAENGIPITFHDCVVAACVVFSGRETCSLCSVKRYFVFNCVLDLFASCNSVSWFRWNARRIGDGNFYSRNV